MIKSRLVNPQGETLKERARKTLQSGLQMQMSSKIEGFEKLRRSRSDFDSRS